MVTAFLQLQGLRPAVTRRGSGFELSGRCQLGTKDVFSAAVLLTLRHDPEHGGQATLGNLVSQLQFDPLWKVAVNLSPEEIADWKAVPPGGRQGQCKQTDGISY